MSSLTIKILPHNKEAVESPFQFTASSLQPPNNTYKTPGSLRKNSLKEITEIWSIMSLLQWLWVLIQINGLHDGLKCPSELTNTSLQCFTCLLIHLTSANCSPSSSNIRVCPHTSRPLCLLYPLHDSLPHLTQLFICHHILNYNPTLVHTPNFIPLLFYHSYTLPILCPVLLLP